MKTIFDIGSNNGDDIPYYLQKAGRVVAFEANPILCRKIAERFSDQIAVGRLVIEQGVLCTDDDATSSKMCFYIHKWMDVLSQFPEPAADRIGEFEKIELPPLRLSDMIRRYGEPYYAKIDIEHYDQFILAELFRLGVFPEFLSIECHSQRAASLLLENPAYTGFKLVNGADVASKYENAEIRTLDGGIGEYSFPHHSAGPFGEDIAGPWHDRKSMQRLMALQGLGWRDLHASKRDMGKRVKVMTSISDLMKVSKYYLKPYLPGPALKLWRKFRRLFH